MIVETAQQSTIAGACKASESPDSDAVKASSGFVLDIAGSGNAGFVSVVRYHSKPRTSTN